MKNKMIMALLLLTWLAKAQNKLPFQLEKSFETTGFEAPESVVKDYGNNILYVSNINGNPGDKDGNGYISKVDLSGKIVEQKWITGLNAPKGLAIHKNRLFVADIDEIVEIDIATGHKTAHKAEGSTFLNDIAIDKKGTVYASNTFGFSGIYRLKNGKVTLWGNTEDLNMPNGLFVYEKDLYIANWGIGFDPNTYATEKPGSLIKINTKNKAITAITQPAGNLDGLAQTLHGYLLTDWLAGKLLYYNGKDKIVTEALDLPQGSADIFFDKETKTVYIPLMNNGKLLAYQFKK